MKVKRWLQDIDLSWLRSLSYVWFVPPALFIGGLQDLYTALRYPNPVAYTVEDYVGDRPSDKWLILQDATLEVSSTEYVTLPVLGLVTDAYIPVFSSEREAAHCFWQMDSECIHILVTTQNRRWINGLENAVTEERSQDLTGMVKFGIFGGTSDRRRWLDQQYDGRLAHDVMILELNARPNRWRAVGFIGGGTVVGLWLLKPRFS